MASPVDKEDPQFEDLLRAVISWLQNWRAVPRERSKAADWAVVILTVLLAIAAFWSAFLFQGQLTEARKAGDLASESFRMDERAWIVLEKVNPTLTAPANAKFPASFNCEISLRNVGKTVATNVEVKAQSIFSAGGFGDHADGVRNTQDHLLADITKPPGSSLGPPPNPVPKMLAPNSTSPVPFKLGCNAPQSFSSGFQWMNYDIGRVDYCDQFRVKHWLKFCFYVANARGELWNCQYGNDGDRNSEMVKLDTSCDGSP